MIERQEPADHRPIARLRRLADALALARLPQPEDAAWLVSAASVYEASARAGVAISLDRAMGLGQAGRDAWWTTELRSRRDHLLRELHSRHFPDLSSSRAAVEILRLARQVQQGGSGSVQQNEQLVLVAEALLSGQRIPGAKQIGRILDMKPPQLMTS